MSVKHGKCDIILETEFSVYQNSDELIRIATTRGIGSLSVLTINATVFHKESKLGELIFSAELWFYYKYRTGQYIPGHGYAWEWKRNEAKFEANTVERLYRALMRFNWKKGYIMGYESPSEEEYGNEAQCQNAKERVAKEKVAFEHILEQLRGALPALKRKGASLDRKLRGFEKIASRK